eukprot:3815791-Pyramimonas_sp.AAC.1
MRRMRRRIIIMRRRSSCAIKALGGRYERRESARGQEQGTESRHRMGYTRPLSDTAPATPEALHRMGHLAMLQRHTPRCYLIVQVAPHRVHRV